jgi:hypothetical protein
MALQHRSTMARMERTGMGVPAPHEATQVMAMVLAHPYTRRRRVGGCV